MERRKERWKIEELVFDRITLLTLGRMIKKGIFDRIEGILSTGKEANVYRGKSVLSGKERDVAIKIYKIETTKFVRRMAYLLNDPKLLKTKSIRDVVYAFALKEFKNLEKAKQAKVSCPGPLYQEKNVVVMEFLGKQGVAFPKLKEAVEYIEKENGEKLFEEIIKDIKNLYKHNLVHSDLSEYNILVGEKRGKIKHYFIDFGQAVSSSHPNAERFLERDVKNLVKFFEKKIGIKRKAEEILEKIKKG